MHEAVISALSAAMRLLPDCLPGKTRLGRTLLGPFLSRTPALLNDCFGCSFVLPSYAEPMAQHIFTFGAYELETRGGEELFAPLRRGGCMLLAMPARMHGPSRQ
jgi:hypothetical protein